MCPCNNTYLRDQWRKEAKEKSISERRSDIMVKRKIYILSPKKPKRKMPSQETQRARDIALCAKGQSLEVRKSCFKDPYTTMKKSWYTEVSEKAKKKKK